MRLGVSVDAISQIVRVATVGDIEANVPKLNEGERRIPIRIRLPADARPGRYRTDIRPLRVPDGQRRDDNARRPSPEERRLPGAGPARIDRLNRQRQITIQAELNGGVELGDATAAVKKLPIMQHLPSGVAPAATGNAEAQQELFAGFGLAIFAGVSMIYGVLVLLSRSFFKPGVHPVGPAAWRWAARSWACSPSISAVDPLADRLPDAAGPGRAKNSILLVEYAIERERRGA